MSGYYVKSELVQATPDSAGVYRIVDTAGNVSYCTEKELKQRFVRVDGRRIDDKAVRDFIVSTEVQTMGGRTTVVRANLRNGWGVVESSSCPDPASYDPELSYRDCMNRIYDRVWELLSFLLQTAISGVTDYAA